LVLEFDHANVMNQKLKSITPVLLAIIYVGSTTTQANAAFTLESPMSQKQILLDTGGGGGEGPVLSGVKWTFGATANGNPFIFWTWSPTN